MTQTTKGLLLLCFAVILSARLSSADSIFSILNRQSASALIDEYVLLTLSCGFLYASNINVVVSSLSGKHGFREAVWKRCWNVV